MRNVFQTFSRRNPIIGYVQGMNFILARMLKYSGNEESTFWIFTNLMETILPINYYTQMIGVRVDVKVFDKLIQENMPRLYRHL